jgi:hypothetical protein
MRKTKKIRWGFAMKALSPAQYIAEMRQIEGQRNLASCQGDRRALQDLQSRSADLSRRFFGRHRG